MRKSLVWQITKAGPKFIDECKLKLEELLERWIVDVPDLLQVGLFVIGRQLHLQDAGRIDILALDPAGRFVVVEIKRGTLYRETVAQGVDYAECIKSLSADDLVAMCDKFLKPRGKSLRQLLEERDALAQLEPEQRNVLLYVVGTGMTERLPRLAKFLQNSLPIYLVVFDYYTLTGGQQIVVREFSEADEVKPTVNKSSNVSLDGLLRESTQAGIGSDFKRFCDAAQSFGLYPRLWKHSVMFAPRQSKNRMIFTVWAKPVRKKLRLFLSPEAIAEFYPISVSAAKRVVGRAGWYELDSNELTTLLRALNKMFADFKEANDETEGEPQR